MKRKKHFNITMQDLEEVKVKMSEFFNTQETIHISFDSKKVIVIRDPSKVEAVYNHFCIIKPIEIDYEEAFTIQYVDIASGLVEIEEFPVHFGAKINKK